MAALIWGAWGAEWAQNKKVAFNGVARTITVNDDVTTLDLQIDVWSRWADWAALPGNDYHALAMRKTGYDAIPGGRSGLIYFLRNGWKLIVDLNKVRVSGVLYSDDYETAYWSVTGEPIYPAVVSSLVNTAVTYQNVVTGTALTSEQTAEAVWSKLLEGLSAEQMMRIMLAAVAGKRQGLGTAVEEYLGQDGVTPRITLTADANGNGTPVLNGAA